MNVDAVGNPGGGKTTIGAVQAILDLEAGRPVMTSFSCFYRANCYNDLSGQLPNVADRIDVAEFALRALRDRIQFPMGSASMEIDEAYLIFESRKSIDPIQVVMTEFPLQARKMGVDLMVMMQLASSVDKRLRFIADRRVLCTKHYDGNGRVFFNYEMASQTEGYLGNFELNAENAEKVFPYFISNELQEPPFYEQSAREELLDKILWVFDHEGRNRVAQGPHMYAKGV